MEDTKTMEIKSNSYGATDSITVSTPIEKYTHPKKLPSFWESGQVRRALTSGIFTKRNDEKTETGREKGPMKTQKYDDVEMEKLIFNCNENIHSDDSNRLIGDLERYSCRNRSCDRERTYYEKIFWIIVFFFIILINDC